MQLLSCGHKGALDGFKTSVEAEKPDALIVTGDLIVFARFHELAAAGAWLKSLATPYSFKWEQSGLSKVKQMRQVSYSPKRGCSMSLGLILIIVLVIFLLGGFSGRFGGYGYGFGHGGVGVIGIILIVVVILLLMGRL